MGARGPPLCRFQGNPSWDTPGTLVGAGTAGEGVVLPRTHADKAMKEQEQPLPL